MTASEEFRSHAHAIWEASYAHPFVQGIGEGTLPEERFRYYLAQDYVYLIEFSRFFALAAAKARALGAMERFATLLDETLHFEMDLHRRICAEFGLARESLEKTRPAPTCLGYTSYLLKVAYEGELLTVLAALLPCSWGYGEIGLRLKAKGLPPVSHYAQWVETYASPEYQQLVDWLRGLFDEAAGEMWGASRQTLRETFDTSSRWEYLFWEMAWGMEGWPV
jgi:thiaminase (transcriptional activator TenA)